MQPLFEIIASDKQEVTILVDGVLALRLSGPFAEVVLTALHAAPNQRALCSLATGIYLGAAAGIYGRVEVTSLDEVPGMAQMTDGESSNATISRPDGQDELAQQENQPGPRWPLDPLCGSERRSPSA